MSDMLSLSLSRSLSLSLSLYFDYAIIYRNYLTEIETYLTHVQLKPIQQANRRHIDIFFLIFVENKIWHLMHIAS